MANRSGRGDAVKGSLVQRGKSWRMKVDAGMDPVTGKRRQLTRTIPPVDGKPVGKRAAQDLLRLFVEEASSPSDRSQASLRELFAAYQDIRRSNSPGTRREALRRFELYVPERVQKMAVGKITAYTLDRLYLSLDRLAPSTVARLHTDLAATFAQGVKWGWVRENPALKASPPNIPHHEVQPPSVEQVRDLIIRLDSMNRAKTQLPDFVQLLLATGARPSELCAATIADLDFASGRLWIRRSFSRGDGGTVKTTKTGRARVVKLDKDTLAAMRDRRLRLAAVAMLAGLPVEETWWFPAPNDSSRPMWGTSISREFRKVRGDVETLTLRNLRHFVASTLVAGGVDVTTAAGRLGHGAGMLLNTYAHVMESADDAAADVVQHTLHAVRNA